MKTVIKIFNLMHIITFVCLIWCSIIVADTNKELEQITLQVIAKTESYINEAREIDRRVVLESYGFALALSYNIDNLKLRDEIEKKIIKSLKEFAFEDLYLVKDIELANLSSNHKNFKGRFENIRLQYAQIKGGDLLTHLKQIEYAYQKVIKDMFAYIHGMLGGPPLDTRYAMVSVGSLATQMTTPYSDIEYIILLDKHNDENIVYFTNFADLFELLLIGFGESPIYKADIFLSEFKPYFKYMRKGIRVDEHKKPQDINKLYGLINTPEELLAKIPIKIIHQSGNHLTSALLTTGYLDGDVELYTRFSNLFNKVLTTKEYWRCLSKLLQQDLLASTGFCTQLHNSFLKKQYKKEIEVKDVLINIMHMLRTAGLFIKSSGSDLVLEPNFFKLIASLRKDNFLTEKQHRELSDLVTILFELRLELQISKQSSGAKLELGELDRRVGVVKLLSQMQDISRSVKGWLEEKKDKQPGTSIADILNAPHIVWNLPKQDHKFVGRKDLLDELQAKLHPKTEITPDSNKQLAMVSVCAGLGGVGKTQLALQYIHHAKQHYTLKAWFQAENLDQLKQQYMEFAIKLGFKDKEPSFERVLHYIKEYLSKHSDWLLVYDNVTSYEEIKDFLPNYGGAIILTTRQKKWPNAFEKIDIEVMSELDAIELIQSLIQRSIQPDEQEIIKELVNKLGYLPLALGQAGAYIKQNAISLTDYLNMYKEYEEELLLDNTLPEGTNSLPIATTWNLSLEAIVKEAKLNKQQPLALHLLTVCAYLAPDKIPKSLLLTWLKESHPELKNPELILPKIIGQLWQYSMISKDNDGNITVHRLVQAVVRHQHQEEKNKKNYPNFNQKWFDVLFKALHAEFTKKTQILEDEARQKSLLPHLQSLLQYHEQLWPDTLQLSRTSILNDIGAAFSLTGEYRAAKFYYKRALSILEENYGSDSIKLAKILDSLGNSYRGLGEHKESQLLYERALKIKEKHYDKDNIEMAFTLDQLGRNYRYLGDPYQAKKSHEHALKIKEKYYGKDHLEIAFTLDHLGRAYRVLGDAKNAKELHERGLKIKQKYYGKDHIEVADTLDYLGRDYRVLDDAQYAKELHERSIKIKEDHYGKEHIIIAIALDQLGRDYRILGDAQYAKELHERSISIKEKYYEKDHISTAITIDHLGRDYRVLGDAQYAKELHERSVKIKEDNYGANHIEVAVTLDQLGLDYIALGMIKQATEIHEHVLNIKAEYDGNDSVNIAYTLDYLGDAYTKLGDIEQAKICLEKALKIQENYYGADNTMLVKMLLSLATVSKFESDVKQALTYLNRALKIRQQYFGVTHQLTKEIEQIIDNFTKPESLNIN